MGVLQHNMIQQTGAWSVDPTDPWRGGSAVAETAMPAGWWLVPGLALGLGLWALVGLGIYSALAGGGAGGEQVTMAAPLDTGPFAGQ